MIRALVVGGVAAVAAAFVLGGGRRGSGERGRVIRAARSLVGLDAHSDPLGFAQALGPAPAGDEGWAPVMAQGTRTTTCAIVARSVLRRAGAALASLRAPYEWGSGLSDVVAAAVEAHAVDRSPRPPLPGDFVVWDAGDENGQHHVATVVAIDGDTATTVDGGLSDADGYQKIDAVRRPLASVTPPAVAFVLRSTPELFARK